MLKITIQLNSCRLICIHRSANAQTSPIWLQSLFESYWEVALDFFVICPLVHQKVLTHNNDAAWTVVSGHLDQAMGRLVHWEDVFTNDVVQAQIHLIKCQRLLEIPCVHCAKVLVKIAVVDF